MRLQVVTTALLALSACSRTTEGPSPAVERIVNPRARVSELPQVCNAQGGQTGWSLEVVGKRFTPVPGEALTDTPTVELPVVTLRGPSTYTLTRSQVFYVRPELLVLNVPTRDSTPPVELAPGTYEVEVANPLGGTGSLPDAVRVVPPPTVTRVVPPVDGYTATGTNPIVIEGSDFQPGSSPIIVLRREGETDLPLFFVTVVSTTRIESEIPPGTPEGLYDLVVTQPEGCADIAPGAVDLRYPHLGALTLTPRSGGELSNTAIRLFNAPTGDQRGFTDAPELFVLASLKTAPSVLQRIPLRAVTRVSANEVTAELPTCSGFEEPVSDPKCPNGLAPGGPYALEVIDPSGAVGAVPASEGFTVVAEPTATRTSDDGAPPLPGALLP
ncbi:MULTISPECIES: hypothetical protein [unclassified Myxococcus]|uniref:hypothetical protein n=1 Tax=unclassified Myxococcus TaxID=2648731 RepID=UPI00157A52E0|nr:MULTISPECIES: hypothetical protein [unclassified Myxococcus]NTX38359.1 hypothetical protein [Myxococcus sp. CA033]NTX54123.1 hypothetical protein [Myxococcus sp. CA039A]